MKLIYLTLCALSLFPCKVVQKKSALSIQNNYKLNDSSIAYKIIKIDTIKNINVIFAKKNELTYKIVLVLDSLHCKNNIKTGACYKLLLKSVFTEDFGLRNNVSAVRYGSIQINLEKNNGILWDLFYIQNIRELCNQLEMQVQSDTPLPLK